MDDEHDTDENCAARAIKAVGNGKLAYCKFLSANDTGDTGGHQVGIYVAKNALSILFECPGERGANKDKRVKVKWQNDFETDSRFVYYGQGTRNEYRITRFGRGFPFLTTEHTGDLFVLVKRDNEDYLGYILSTEDEINAFLEYFGMSPADTGNVIEPGVFGIEAHLDQAMQEFIDALTVDFPETKEMALAAQNIEDEVFGHTEDALLRPDGKLLAWIETEYSLFRKLEQVRYGGVIAEGFPSVEQFVVLANSILNKRKSRAGKSLEHHLARIFDFNALRYSAQPRTEGTKRPDFLFPSEAAYHAPNYPCEKLVFLAAKTTCKDRWRQVINEADRFKGGDRMKHLFTLQQGISSQQMDEMQEEGVVLVVPQPYIASYPATKRERIWTLKKFVGYAKEQTIP
ncbi:MAG: type II restriction endonuclease [Coriobacteriales bacterium]|jgi:type II restriction enzyme|nr:type II restriction endonuclease [Coriobacteriales bacterium]